MVSNGAAGGLGYIAYQSTHDYDFSYNSHRNDTYTYDGEKMDASDFGNFIAGFEGSIWDQAFGVNAGVAQTAVEAAGVLYHIFGLTEAIDDPWDRTGMPFIKKGAKAAKRKKVINCLCKK